ncbi:IclR family transcriptional regulator [Rhodobacteraceae bacterium NNCM2]|nr:IclR family transcriptional regulator [Coraliihabitans acroporae]
MSDISLSAGKAIVVFRAISNFGEPCSVAQIAEVVGYPRTVTNRMVATLMHYELIERSPQTGRFSVSPMMLHVVQKALAKNPVLGRVELVMREIVRETEDTALYMIKSGDAALVINRVEGSAPVRVLASEVGMELPLHCGGAPLVLLSHSPEEEIQGYLSRPLTKRTKSTATDPEEIRKRIADVRRTGYSIGDGDLFDYVVGVGAPIFHDDGKLAGAVSVGNIIQRYTPERAREVGRILVETIARY